MTAKFFPIMGSDRRNPQARDFYIPWAFLAPHEAQVKINQHGESLEQLARRGGLMVQEALQAVKGERVVDCKLAWWDAKAELLQLVETWNLQQAAETTKALGEVVQA